MNTCDDKEAREELAKAEKKYRGIFENAMEGIFQCTGEGRLIAANPAMAALLGHASADSLAEEFTDFNQSFFEDKGDFESLCKILRQNQVVRGFESRFRTKSGEFRHGLIHARPVFDDLGNLTHIDGMLTDITELKDAQELLRERIEAEARTRATRQFIEALSQEMRAPMNAIMSVADLLLETELSDQQAQYVQTMKAAGESLISLAANILVLSKVEAKTLELERIHFSLLELVEKTCETLAVKAHDKKLDLSCSVQPGVPNRLVGDPFHLRQVLVNVAHYAMALAREGELAVIVRPAPDDEKPPESEGREMVGVEFCVAAGSVAFPDGGVHEIFDHFSQADPAGGGEEANHRLGLRIASQVVELMGGRIRGGNDGSALCFTVFCERQEKGTDLFSSTSPLKDVSVLVADNDLKGRNQLKEILNEVGAKVTEADDAQSAITLLRDAWMLPKPYDLTILAQSMPDMTGVDAAEIIRIEHLSPLCVLLLNFSASREDVNKARENGLEYFLKKPFKRPNVLKVVKAAIRREAVEKPITEIESGEEDLPPVDILLVEDSETNRFVIRAYLKNTPCRIHIAENGAKAVEKFASQDFDLILMDMQMPVMDGYEALASIRNQEKEKNAKKTPIIAMTADARQEDEIKYIDTGFDGFLAKPIKKNLLLTTLVHQILGPRKVKPKNPISRIMDTLATGRDEPLLAWVNPDLEAMAPEYLEGLKKKAADIPDQVAGDQFDRLRTLGHQMKGEGEAFGFEAISRLGAVIEDAAARKHRDKILEFGEKLKDYLARVEIV